MEDEDEITHSVEEQVSTVEPPQKEEEEEEEKESEVTEQCGTAEHSSESLSPEKITEEVVVEREDDAVKSKFKGAVMEEMAVALDDGVMMEENVEVSKSEVDDGVKVEEVEMEKEKERPNEGGIVDKLRLDDDKLEVSGEKRDGFPSMDGDGGVRTEELEMNLEQVIEKAKPNSDNENIGEGSREGEVIFNAGGGLGIGEQAEKEEQVVGEEGSEGAEKGEVMLGEEGGEGAEKEEHVVGKEGGEGAEKGELMLGEEGGGGAEEEEVVGEEGGEAVEKEEEVVGGGEEEEEERGEEMEDSEATGDGEVSPPSPVVAEEEDTPIADTEMEMESEVIRSGSGSGGKRRRGRIPKASTPVKVPARKIVGEDVCFICLDGGDLVLCDRRFVCFFLL